MKRIEFIQLMLADLTARARLLAEEVPRLEGKRLSDAEHELRYIEIKVRHYEGKLAVELAKLPSSDPQGDADPAAD